MLGLLVVVGRPRHHPAQNTHLLRHLVRNLPLIWKVTGVLNLSIVYLILALEQKVSRVLMTLPINVVVENELAILLGMIAATASIIHIRDKS